MPYPSDTHVGQARASSHGSDELCRNCLVGHGLSYRLISCFAINFEFVLERQRMKFEDAVAST